MNTQAVYKRVLSGLLGKHKECCGVYIDDIVISSYTREEHARALHAVLQTLAEKSYNHKY